MKNTYGVEIGKDFLRDKNQKTQFCNDQKNI